MPSSRNSFTGVAGYETGPGPGLPPCDQRVGESQAGSRDAFGELVAQYHAQIYNFLLKLTGQRQDAEDLTQETFLKAWQSIGRFDARYSFATWLFTIAKRTAYNHFRAREPVAGPGEPAAPEAADNADPSLVMSQDEAKRELWDLARTLKPRQYQLLWLRYGEGFSVAEAVKIMGLHPIHARVLLHRGRGKLAQLLGKDL